MARKEVIDTEVVIGIFNGIKFAKQQIVNKLIEEKIAPAATTIDDVEWIPFVGHKNSDNLKNIGKIIGYCVSQIKGVHDPQKIKAARYYELRVDFDQEKKAHINYQSSKPNSGFVRAVRVDIEDWRLRIRFNSDPEQAVLETWEDLTRRHHTDPEVYNVHDEVHRVLSKQSMKFRHTTIATNPYRMQHSAANIADLPTPMPKDYREAKHE
jgi:hypothetical protein